MSEKPIFHFIKGFNNAAGRRFTNTSGEIGIEIETETVSSEDYPPAYLQRTARGYTVEHLLYWKGFKDDSLRNFGLEYALRVPLKYGADLDTAFEEFKRFAREIKFIKDPVKASTHVHLNMLNETFRTMGNFFTLYSLYENLLIRYSGPNRLSNMFCIPICDGEDTSRNMKQMITAASEKNYQGLFFAENAVKYAALNLSAFYTYGSIEVRSFRGSTDVKEVHKWVSILWYMIQYARKDITPHDIIFQYDKDPEKLFKNVFHHLAKELYVPDMEQLVKDNLWYAAGIAFLISADQWKNLSEVPELKTDFPIKMLDEVAMNRFGVPYEIVDRIGQEWIIRYLNEREQAPISKKLRVRID